MNKTPTPRCTLHPSAGLKRLSPEGGHWFFGYYDKSLFDAAGQRVLCGRSTFLDRMPTPDDELELGWLDADAEEPSFERIGSTRAWCWQQGTMLQWLGPGFDQQVVYNTVDQNRQAFAGRIVDPADGSAIILDRPIYALDPLGRFALSLNFSRLHRTRPGYGYAGVDDATAGDDAPEDDGVWNVPLDGATPRLIFSLADAARLSPVPSQQGVEHWFNHIQLNPDASRLAFLHRWRKGRYGFLSRLITIDPEGNEPHLLADLDLFSHYDWVDRTSLVGWTAAPDRGSR